MINIYNKLSDVHNDIEKVVLSIIRPGLYVSELCLFIEQQIEARTSNIECVNSKGIAFPVGININNCAAHYSVIDPNGSRVFLVDDVVKIDYGIHIDGYILDAAFTVAFKEEYRELLEASRKACMDSAKLFTHNKPLIDITKNIQSCIPSNFGVIRDLCGHQIKPYMIHGGKVVPNVVIPYNMKALEGEVYTVEPFVSTSKNPQTYEDTKDYSHYMYNYFTNIFNSSSPVLKMLPELSKRSTLAFNIRWLPSSEQAYLDKLVDKKVYNVYPPIYEKDTEAKIAQFETTLLVTSGEPILFKEYNSVDDYIITNRL
jgi:methionyl aminopeptidase